MIPFFVAAIGTSLAHFAEGVVLGAAVYLSMRDRDR